MAQFSKFYIMWVVFLCSLYVPTSVTARKAQMKEIALDFSVHQIETGPNATLLLVAGTGGMGTMTVFDNTVHEGENLDSKLLGQATGSGIATTTHGLVGGLQIQSQITFGGSSLYNGSSILFMGTVLTPVAPWEVMVGGGTGCFCGIQGYAYVQPGRAFPPTYTYKWNVRGWLLEANCGRNQ